MEEPCITNVLTVFVCILVSFVQCTPLSVERYAKPPFVLAITVFPFAMMAFTAVSTGSPATRDSQLVPLFVETYTPLPVPAYNVVFWNAREYTFISPKPLFLACQLAPLSVERNTPPPCEAANKFPPLCTKARVVLAPGIFISTQPA